jgi:hypothetical protein
MVVLQIQVTMYEDNLQSHYHQMVMKQLQQVQMKHLLLLLLMISQLQL